MAKPRTEVRTSVRGETSHPDKKAVDAKRRRVQPSKSARTNQALDADKGKRGADAKRRRAKPSKSATMSDKNFKGYDATKGKPDHLKELRCKERPKDNKPKGGGGSGKRFVPWC